MFIRTILDKDLEALPDFLHEGYSFIPPSVWKQRFAMWWGKNPSYHENIPRGWVVEGNNGEIVGFLGNIPVKFQINGEMGLAFAGTSWYVREAARGFSLAMKQRQYQQNADLFLDTTPTKNVESILRKFGALSVDVPYNHVMYQTVRDLRSKMIGVFYQKTRNPVLRDMAQILTVPLDVCSSIRRSLQKKGAYDVQHSPFTCNLVRHCGDAFTDLWMTHREKGKTCLWRDAETLNWLFFSDLVKDIRHVIACHRKDDGVLTGYMVFDFFPLFSGQYPKLNMIDAYVPGGDSASIREMVRCSTSLANRLAAAVITYYSPDETIDQIFRTLFHFRKNSVYPHYYKFRTPGMGSYDRILPTLLEPNHGTLGIQGLMT